MGLFRVFYDVVSGCDSSGVCFRSGFSGLFVVCVAVGVCHCLLPLCDAVGGVVVVFVCVDNFCHFFSDGGGFVVYVVLVSKDGGHGLFVVCLYWWGCGCGVL